MELAKLIEEAKDRANIVSDYALSKVLGVSNGDIAYWKKGKRHPSIEAATKLAILAGRNEMQVIAAIELQTAKTDEKRKFWKHYIESRGITAAVTLTALAFSLTLASEPAESSVLQLQNYDANASFFATRSIHYAKF